MAGKSKQMIRQPGAWPALLFCFLAVVATLALTSRDASQRRSMEAPAPNSSDRIVTIANQEEKIVVFGPAGEMIRSALIEAFRKWFPRIVFESTERRKHLEQSSQSCSRYASMFHRTTFQRI